MCSFYDEKEYVVYNRILKEALKYGFFLRKVHRVAKYNQKVWLNQTIRKTES